MYYVLCVCVCVCLQHCFQSQNIIISFKSHVISISLRIILNHTAFFFIHTQSTQQQQLCKSYGCRIECVHFQAIQRHDKIDFQIKTVRYKPVPANFSHTFIFFSSLSLAAQIRFSLCLFDWIDVFCMSVAVEFSSVVFGILALHTIVRTYREFSIFFVWFVHVD